MLFLSHYRVRVFSRISNNVYVRESLHHNSLQLFISLIFNFQFSVMPCITLTLQLVPYSRFISSRNTSFDETKWIPECYSGARFLHSPWKRVEKRASRCNNVSFQQFIPLLTFCAPNYVMLIISLNVDSSSLNYKITQIKNAMCLVTY